MDDSASDVLMMHRLSRRADGGRAVVGWLARRTGNWAGLIDRSGSVLVGDHAMLDASAAAAVASGVQAMVERGLRALSTEHGRGCRIVLLQIDAPDPAAPTLAVAGTRPVPEAVTAGAAAVLGTSWWAAHTRQQLDAADTRNREVVFDLLMSQHTSAARQIASVLDSPLPEHARLHIIDCPPHTRDEVHASCRRWATRSTFIVPSPMRRHVILIEPAGAVDPGEPWLSAVTEFHRACAVGTSDVVALSETRVGYEQAFHALPLARDRPERRARFDATLDPVSLLGTAGAAWAHALLAPLTSHVPARFNHPDAEELTRTLRAWLWFSTGAARKLQIHRNTMQARLERIEKLLGLDLSRGDQQAQLALALRTASVSRTPDPPIAVTPTPTLGDLVQRPELRQWANTFLRPLREAMNAARLEITLRAWLDADARLSTTATALGISIPGARKRLQRIEQLLQRSLLHTPHTRHDLWLAVWAADR